MSSTAVMEHSQRWTNDKEDGHLELSFQIFGQGGYIFPKYKAVLVFLGLLNTILFISAVVLAVKCAKVKEDSLHVPHSSVSPLISEIDNLRSNHSDVIKAQKEAKRALERAIKSHSQLKEQIEHQKTINDEYQRKIAALQVEKANLQSNVSALEGTCGRCLPGWTLLNSSCYFFSYTESSTVKKNWKDSRDNCKRRGSDLIVIDNQEEQKFVSDTIDNMRSGPDQWQSGFWLGLSDTEAEGTWVWINNVTEVEQRYWMDGEPNNLGHRGEDCAVAVYSSESPWKTRYDANCLSKDRQWICEVTSN